MLPSNWVGVMLYIFGEAVVFRSAPVFEFRNWTVIISDPASKFVPFTMKLTEVLTTPLAGVEVMLVTVGLGEITVRIAVLVA